MISNINADRKKKGKGSVGWLNPAMYKHASKFINDIAVGHNKCVAGGAVCCTTGFQATQGWDPTTGKVQYSPVHYTPLLCQFYDVSKFGLLYLDMNNLRFLYFF